MNKKVIGVPSGDYESFCFDINRESFVNLNDNEPDIYDESCFNKDLFREYTVPNVPIWQKKWGKAKFLLEVEYNDWGVVSIKETNIPAIKKPEDQD